MQYVGLLLIAGLCGTFVPTNTLKCYKCNWSVACGTAKNLDDVPTKECGAAGPSADGETFSPTAPAKLPVIRFLSAFESKSNSKHPRSSFSMFADSKTHYCYKVEVKKDGKIVYDRGCQDTDKTDGCVTIDKTKEPTAVVGTCTACENDDYCNAASVTAVSVSCALLSAMLVARIMFIQTK